MISVPLSFTLQGLDYKESAHYLDEDTWPAYADVLDGMHEIEVHEELNSHSNYLICKHWPKISNKYLLLLLIIH